MSKEIDFVDFVNIRVESGDGGDGAIHFHKEKYVSAGGPSGGDGGNGGSVILVADPNLQTLLDFRYKHKFIAENGENGRVKKQYGKKGKDLIIKVPLGTIIKDKESGNFITDLNTEGQTFVIAKGGRGGRGNVHFASSVNKAPHYSEPGRTGEKKDLTLELKSIADVGLVGLPNAGKSSLLSCVSSAKPKIANYPFTTLTPNLGVIKQSEGNSFVMADIPGLIEGAHKGVGLGYKFLRHIERTRLLVHLIDISVDNPLEDFETVNHELMVYPSNIQEKSRIIALNKIDLFLPEEVNEIVDKFKNLGYSVFSISAISQQGIKELINYIAQILPTIPKQEIIHKYTENLETKEVPELFTITKEEGVWVINSERLQKLLELTDISNQRAFNRFMKILTGSGVLESLKELNVQEGNTVRLGNFEFDYLPD